MRRSNAPETAVSETVARPSAALRDQDHGLLEEAMGLLGLDEPAEVLRLALCELVQRQRFLALVAQHEGAPSDLDPRA